MKSSPLSNCVSKKFVRPVHFLSSETDECFQA